MKVMPGGKPEFLIFHSRYNALPGMVLLDPVWFQEAEELRLNEQSYGLSICQGNIFCCSIERVRIEERSNDA